MVRCSCLFARSPILSHLDRQAGRQAGRQPLREYGHLPRPGLSSVPCWPAVKLGEERHCQQSSVKLCDDWTRRLAALRQSSTKQVTAASGHLPTPLSPAAWFGWFANHGSPGRPRPNNTLSARRVVAEPGPPLALPIFSTGDTAAPRMRPGRINPLAVPMPLSTRRPGHPSKPPSSPG